MCLASKAQRLSAMISLMSSPRSSLALSSSRLMVWTGSTPNAAFGWGWSMVRALSLRSATVGTSGALGLSAVAVCRDELRQAEPRRRSRSPGSSSAIAARRAMGSPGAVRVLGGWASARLAIVVGSAEREAIGLDPRLEELDLDDGLVDLPGPADQLIRP